ncbi:MAG TPA: formate dehydrogenase accessory sulfurtransferase FdhD [Thermomicrobiaceae bacterium]|nr:formate dehydrogenase accessory sulfurtransferase FdhD [Thermomicrobiaceae bacterium]
MALAEPPAQLAHPVVRLHDGQWRSAGDVLAVEEPLEIRLIWEEDGQERRQSIAITMRTPGDDFELAAGFLRGEGIIAGREDVLDVSYCLDEDEAEEQRLNIVSVRLRPDLAFDLDRLQRHFYTTSSCGVCGKAALEALDLQGCRVLPDGPQVGPEVIQSLPETLKRAQAVFRATGGLHAAGLFDVTGRLLDLREDVGRHNALDKLVGYQLLRGVDALDGRLLLLSGRASFELLQKALAARIPVVAAVGAPSSLAVELAASFNITLLGFVRPNGFNLYTGQQRIVADIA